MQDQLLAPSFDRPQWVTVLGATGSIGQSTLDVINRHPESYRVFALSGNQNQELLFKQCLSFHPRYAVVLDQKIALSLQERLRASKLSTEVLCGGESLIDVVVDDTVDIVMAAIVGAAGVPATMAAASAGKKILLANKESLVVAGELVMPLVRQSGATLLPIDSEHNALFQCLPNGVIGSDSCGVERLLLTASGGPFRTLSYDEMSGVTLAQALKHPNWSMGSKITIDSASMMNKGLEIIEACWLFDVPESRVDVVVHPQSVIHSMVSYRDGSVMAQMGNPDMRTPIAYGLSWPHRIDAGVSPLDLIAVSQLNFEAPDELKFPSLRLAREVQRAGGTAGAILNAANEIAVSAFLSEKCGFLDIAKTVEWVLDSIEISTVDSLDVLFEADKAARGLARKRLSA